MKLSDLHTGERGVIVKVSGHGGFRKRIVEMGFVKGKTVKVVLNAPLRDPIEYEIMGYKISLRREEAALVEVISEGEAQSDARLHPGEDLRGIEYDAVDRAEGCALLDRRMERMAAAKRRVINVALVGNPNCGKTSLFNFASGGHEHVGNYSGVTVDAKEGFFTLQVPVSNEPGQPMEAAECKKCRGCKGCSEGAACHAKVKEYNIRLIDLPGTYSLTAYSPEERYVRHHLIEEMPDVVVNVLDASNLERNLYLTTQLIDMHQRMVVALNMYDEVEKSGDRLEYEQLGHLLGVPMVPTVSRTGKGVHKLFETVVAVYENQNNSALARHIHVNHGRELEQSIDRVKAVFQKNRDIRYKYSTRYLSIKFLENDSEVEAYVETLPEHDELIAVRFEEQRRIKAELHDSAENAMVDAKYGFIQGALRETYRAGGLSVKRRKQTCTERIDRIVTNRWMGFPLFLFVLFAIFESTFILGDYPMSWIEWLVERFGDFVRANMPEGVLKDMVVDGIIGGVGSVIVFLPNILLLYLFISLLEDTGYMARAAFIMDKLMHRMGLHGKSFIPMLMGFGCNVPAIMAARTVENPKSRLITMLITPFMSCSARLPIYIVLLGAFFPAHAGSMLLGLYALGILVAVLFARIFSRFLIRGEDLPFVMELPPYRVPNARSVFRHTWEKGEQYLRKMGGIILLFSVVIWALGYFPRQEAGLESRMAEVRKVESPVASAETLQASYLEQIGKIVSPLVAPLGFDWKMSVGILSGIGAKELMVSTLAVMYAGEEIDTDAPAEGSRLAQSLTQSISSASALAYLVFALLYFPCIATIAAIRSESGGWKWAIFTAAYTTAVAYLFSFVAYRFMLAFGA